MTSENRETMQRAIGIIEGAQFGAPPRIKYALEFAISILGDVLEKESTGNNDN